MALGFLLWLVNFYISASTLGNVWTILGVLFFGVGVFVTAGLGLLLNHQFSDLFIMLIYLVTIYGIRMLGLFIASKYPSVSYKVQHDEAEAEQ